MRKNANYSRTYRRTSSGATNGKLRAKLREFYSKSKGYTFTPAEQSIITSAKYAANGGKTMPKAKYMQFVRMVNRM